MNDSISHFTTTVTAAVTATAPASATIDIPSDTPPKKAARYVRPVSPLERYSLVLNEAYRYHVDGIVEGSGTVSREQLQQAVDRAAAANPAIRVRLRGWLQYSRWVDSGIAPQVRLLPTSEWDGGSEQNAPFLLERLQPMRGGPVADVLIVPGRDGKTRLVFRTLHAAIDGRGFLHWVAEVCRAMRGEPLGGSNSALIDIDIQQQHADKVAPEPPAAPALCIPVLAPSVGGRAPLGYVWRRLVIDNSVSQLLPKTAVFLAQWARRREPGDVGFTVPVDYRGLRTQEMGLGNLTGYVRLTVPEDATPRSLMLQFGHSLRAYADCRQIPGIRLLLKLPVWYMLRKGRPNVDKALYTVTPSVPSGGIVSMGNVSGDTYSFPGFDARMIYGIPGAVGKLNVVFLNYPDFTVISFAAPAAYNHEGQLDELIAAYSRHFSKQSPANTERSA
ncbi:MAG: hypothetical protein JWQ90_1312 [Hydrocarboniphaga sp.]|uniref:hypothetical protein n=1 Tax=Hydrocarboniphaga sp. TaxID=2033016 RepID=UPI002620038F|nr:hypothetical protein [Hydrocarboniphaga sp.]MDB5968862.1 hypothetical protein [Hydrocarboniphaga sp.]